MSKTLALLAVLLASDHAIQTAVDSRFKEWVEAENKRDAAAVTNLYDDDAVLMPKAEEPVIGKAAIGEYYKKLMANPHFVPFGLTVHPNSFHVVRDIAIETADFDGDLTRNDKHIHFRGKMLLVWKKRKDGSWKIFRYMFDEIT